MVRMLLKALLIGTNAPSALELKNRSEERRVGKECTAVNAIHHKAPEMSTLEDTHM